MKWFNWKHILKLLKSVFFERQAIWFLSVTIFLTLLSASGSFLLLIVTIFSTSNIVRFFFQGLKKKKWDFTYIVIASFFWLPLWKSYYSFYNVVLYALFVVAALIFILTRKEFENKVYHRLTFLVILSAVFLFIPAQNLIKHNLDSSLRVWGEKISWSDFLSEERPPMDNEYVATICTDFEYKYNKCFNYPKVISFTMMYRFASWASAVSAKYDEDNHLLNHEQIHFDISEWTRQEFQDSIIRHHPLSEETVAEIYVHFRALQNERQDEYDRQTNHGVNISVQEKWNEKLKNKTGND